MTDNQEQQATAATRLAWAKEFKENPFWRKIMKPAFEMRKSQILAELVTCELQDVKKIRGMIVAFDYSANFVDDFIASVEAEIAIDKAQLNEIAEMMRKR